MPRNKNLLCCLIFLIAGVLFSVYFYSKPIHDFGNYYYGSRFVLEGKNINDIYEPYKFNLAVRDLPEMQHEKFMLNHAVVPPATLFFYMPLTVLDVHLSKLLFNLISILVFCYFLFRLLKLLNINSNWIILLPLLIIIPFRNNLLFGQAYLLIMGLLMGGFIAETRNKNIPAALCYSIAIVLKISPAILLIYLLVRKKIRLLMITILVSTALFFFAVFITGWEFMMDFLMKSIPRMSLNEINNPYATTYQSITVLLRNHFLPDQLLNPDAIFNAPIIFSALNGIFTGIISFLLIIKLKNVTDNFSAFAFTLFGSLVLTSYTSSYSLVFMIPLCLYLFNLKPKSIPFLMLLVLAIANIPVSVFQSLPLIFRFPRLYLLIVLFLIIVSEKNIFRSRLKWIAVSIVFFAGISLAIVKKDDPSSYFLPREAGLLSYDFQISGNNLLFKTLYEDGSRIHEYVLADSVNSVIPLQLVNGQIQYHGPVTIGSDNKLNPVLVNNSQVLYLSDKNRGIGFYALRKIDIRE